MRQAELQRIEVIENAVAGRVILAEASTVFQLSRRQVHRLRAVIAATRWNGCGMATAAGLTKLWRLAETVRCQILELAQSKYPGLNDSHLTEKLVESEGLAVSRKTVRRSLRQAGIRSPQKRRAPKYRARRERKPRMGMMVLTDASREEWVEQRGPALTLMGYQDDATGQVLAARFQLEHEDTIGYLRLLRAMVERWGVPLSLYRDQHSTFQLNDAHWTLEEEPARYSDCLHCRPARPWGGGSAGWIQPAVVVALKLDDEVSTGETTGQPQGQLHGFASGGRKGHALDAGDQRLEHLGYLKLEFMLCPVCMGPLRLAVKRFHHSRVTVAQDERTPGERVIDVLVVVHVAQVTSPTILEVQRDRTLGADPAVHSSVRRQLFLRPGDLIVAEHSSRD